jgi:hypothetical protein
MSIASTRVIAGWSGMPVQGGAGLKPALLYDPATGDYANAAAPDAWYSEAEVSDFATRGLLIKKALRATPVPDGVVLYADDSFIHPAESNRMALDPGPLSLHLIDSRCLWLAYLPKDPAMEVLLGWGARLLEDAAGRLDRFAKGARRREEALRALDSARRARFCTFARIDWASRREVFRCMAVALMMLGQPVESLYADAGIDLSDDEVAELKRDIMRALLGAMQGGHERPIHAVRPTDCVVPLGGQRSPRRLEETW